MYSPLLSPDIVHHRLVNADLRWALKLSQMIRQARWVGKTPTRPIIMLTGHSEKNARVMTAAARLPGRHRISRQRPDFGEKPLYQRNPETWVANPPPPFIKTKKLFRSGSAPPATTNNTYIGRPSAGKVAVTAEVVQQPIVCLDKAPRLPA